MNPFQGITMWPRPRLKPSRAGKEPIKKRAADGRTLSIEYWLPGRCYCATIKSADRKKITTTFMTSEEFNSLSGDAEDMIAQLFLLRAIQ